MTRTKMLQRFERVRRASSGRASGRSRRTRWAAAALAVAAMVAFAPGLLAQLDPLIALKRVPPNVVVVLDTSFRMLDDGQGNYYDVKTYRRNDDPAVSAALGVVTPEYRRIYKGLLLEATITPASKYKTSDIVAVQSTDPGYARFWMPTRWNTARMGLFQAVRENPTLARWGLMKLRQDGEAWRDPTSNNGCDQPVHVTANAALMVVSDNNPCIVPPVGFGNNFGIYAPFTAGPNFAVPSALSDALVYGVASVNATTNILMAMTQSVGTGTLIPGGQDNAAYQDRPITNALTDARAHVVSTMTADALRDCRNTVVVLVTGGKDDGDHNYTDTHDPIATAKTFAAVSANGVTRRVPIVVVGVNVDPNDQAQLRGIAGASGGRYFDATSSAEVTAAVNFAVQMGVSKSADFDAPRASEYTGVSPIVGTVNLTNAKDANGSSLPNTSIVATAGKSKGQSVSQRSNFMVTAGYSLPGFDGRVRAFRVFKPVADATKGLGWKFVADGTRLWPDLDGRPSLAGLARTPSSAASRNIYTFIPNAAGGGQVIAFDVSNAGLIGPHLGGANPNTLIPAVRALPLGAVIGSTPAIMDPPSLDPPPDTDYGYATGVGTFANTYQDRRAMIFFGANDGMVHAVDARTGYEVWAFIPYNLLPKLRTLLDGQSVEQFDYFVDSSPKIAEIKVGGAWKSMMFIGQSYGGTFYTAFDVTKAGMGVAPDDDGIGAVTAMLGTFDTPNEGIQFEWSFPNFSSFDPAITFTASLNDGFPGGQVTLYGDLKMSATDVEKRVGFTFSDPAVGPLKSDRSLNGVITGSGYFPGIENLLPNRGGVPAGRALFVLDAATGKPVNNAGGSCAGTGCLDLGDVNNGRKNALQADVTAATDAGATEVSLAYAGDLDGKYRRFNLTSAGGITPALLIDTQQPIYSSSALLFIGTSSRYLFFGTGSDLLPAANPGAGSAGQGTAFRLYGIQDFSGASTLTYNLSPKVVSTGLLTNGERPTSSPTVAGDIVFFTTVTDSLAASCSDALTRVFAFTYLGTAAYDSSGNGKLDANESPIVATSTGRGTAPFVVDQHLYIGTTSFLGAGITALGDPEDFNNSVGQVGVRILSWREIR